MLEGVELRKIGANSVNDESSRSHAVLQIDIREHRKSCGRLAFIDLAGSERGADTLHHSKQTQQDGAGINRSLLALKECIRAMDQEKLHIPFRDSELTKVLRDIFVGRSRSLMIANVSPSTSCCEQTLNTLRYAARVKKFRPSSSTLTSSPTKPSPPSLSALSSPRFVSGVTPSFPSSCPPVSPDGPTSPHSPAIAVKPSTRATIGLTAMKNSPPAQNSSRLIRKRHVPVAVRTVPKMNTSTFHSTFSSCISSAAKSHPSSSSSRPVSSPATSSNPIRRKHLSGVNLTTATTAATATTTAMTALIDWPSGQDATRETPGGQGWVVRVGERRGRHARTHSVNSTGGDGGGTSGGTGGDGGGGGTGCDGGGGGGDGGGDGGGGGDGDGGGGAGDVDTNTADGVCVHTDTHR
eukprot:GHVS01085399.1.p1 GENE.GHVS01085399.1~~GHVS01085399.1.p1  ORF type:complete len:409 (-),score=125.79 GHVS01085399.1:382-1608(-)